MIQPFLTELQMDQRRLQYLQSMSHQGHVFSLETFKPKIQSNIKLISIPFDLLAA